MLDSYGLVSKAQRPERPQSMKQSCLSLALPLLITSLSSQDGANGELGRNEAAPKMVGSKKKYRSRSTSASSQDSLSSGSYSGSSSDEEGKSIVKE